MSHYYPFDFLIYSVGKHPKYFLKLVAKYDGVLNPTIVLTSATVYRPSFSSLAASLKRILLMSRGFPCGQYRWLILR